MEAGTKVIATNKDGTTVEGTFVSAKSGWTVIATKDGEKKFRSGQVAEKLTKAEAKKRESAARKAEAKPAEEGHANGKLVPADLSKYVVHEATTESGRKKIDIDDETAEKLRGLDLEGTYKYAAKVLDTTVNQLKEKYISLNPGMQRMNLGNRIRKVTRAAAAA